MSRPLLRGLKRRALRVAALAVLLTAGSSCGPARSASESSSVAELRKQAKNSKDPLLLSRWLLGELLSPGGTAKGAQSARQALGDQGGGMYPELARGLDDALHGRLKTVAEHYLAAVQAARESADPAAPLVAWFAAQQASLFRHSDAKLIERWRPFLVSAIAEPRSIGWRARAELADFVQEEAWSHAEKDVAERGAQLHGCVQNLSLAGPFGRNAPRDTTRSFPPERPGPWPQSFEPDLGALETPKVLETERDGCFVSAKEASAPGVYYAESFFELTTPSRVLLAVQGAYGIWVDDHRVLTRDLREWGSWPRFAVALELAPGRHRVVARIAEAGTSIRLLHADGRPLEVPTSTDQHGSYALGAPTLLPEANALDRYLAKGSYTDPGDDVLRFVAAVMANVESQSDVANVLMEPLVAKPENATGAALSMAALFTGGDPIFSDSQRRDLARELRERAVGRDPRLWHPRLLLALNEADRRGNSEAARAVKQLVDEFPEVPAVLSELCRLYSELGWRVEYSKAALELSQRFPGDAGALEPAVEVLDAQGKWAEADALAQRIQKLDADREVVLTRALDRQDYATAIAELKRLAERRPQRKELAERIFDVMVRAGNASENWAKLEAAIKQDPKNEKARLDLADAAYASGKHDALVKALLDALSNGSPSGKLEEAVDLVEGMSELEPYRHDAKKIIAEYERSGEQLVGTAARVLDYAAVWVHADGGSRMLEHEIIKVLSAEAISDLAEQPLQNGILLHMRVIKKDGTVLEPEFVEGKPTATMPHLEAGDYIETERIETQPGDGSRGERYLGPRWFFREENIAYARSEFVVISPKSRPLDIETRNEVPAPTVQEDGAIIARRWRVDSSPAAAVEPFGAPIVEFLQSVQVGWGVSSERTLEAMADASVDMSPVDPRVARVARRILEKAQGQSTLERAKLLYRWLVTNVQEGEESDGRRVVIARNGNLWRGYIALCRAAGIRAEYSVVQNRLMLPPAGPFSAASMFTMPLLRVTADKQAVWLSLGSKHAPFGYVPAEARGMPAFVLSESGSQAVKVPDNGSTDRVIYSGDVRLSADGSAQVDLEQTLQGKYATALRGALSEMASQQIKDLIETRIIGNALRGARVEKYEFLHLDDPDQPLVVRTRSQVPNFAQLAGGVLLVTPPFIPRVGQLAALPVRQTPLLVVDSSEQEILLRLHAPVAGESGGTLQPQVLTEGGYRVAIQDRREGDVIVLDRKITLPAGRVQVNEYPRFLRFARSADDALSASIRVKAK